MLMATMAQRMTEALQLQAAGRWQEAETLFRGLVQEAPRQPEFLHALGLLLHQMGRPLEAIEMLRRCLQAQGPHPAIHSNLGAAYLAAGWLNEAISHCRAAIALDPGLAIAHFNLGAVLLRQDHLEEAERAFRMAVQLQPGDASARCNLGVVLHRLGKNPEAIAALEVAVRLFPTSPQAQHDFGAVLVANGQSERGVQHLREAVRLQPDFAEAHDNLGLGLRYLDLMDEAIACFREALRIQPAHIQARNNLANALQAQGKIVEAIAEFQAALRSDPHNAFAIAALSGLAATGCFRFSEAHLQEITRRADRGDVPLSDRHQLHFALAIEFDRAGEYARAFEHYRAGNELRQALESHRGIPFDPDAHDQFIDRIITTYTPAYFERVGGFGLDIELPLYVVGMMRSGTTLAEQILASHPQIHGAGELTDLNNLTIILPRRLRTTASYPEAMEDLNAVTAQALAQELERHLRRRGQTATRVVDKMPGNFLHLGLIATLLPRARIIHCRRDPLDTCLSCYFQNFAGLVTYAMDLKHLGRYYRAYERLMTHWARCLPVPIFELNYEELTADQEAVSRRLIAFCGLDWDERCLRFHETPRAVRTASVLQVRQPIYRRAVGRWKRYEAFLQPLLAALGHPSATSP
jgi:tetratricopeptide (TPR) repeat protein